VFGRSEVKSFIRGKKGGKMRDDNIKDLQGWLKRNAKISLSGQGTKGERIGNRPKGPYLKEPEGKRRQTKCITPSNCYKRRSQNGDIKIVQWTGWKNKGNFPVSLHRVTKKKGESEGS